MRSITLSQLRNTRQLKAWLQAGETVELRERDKVLGRIVPDAAQIVSDAPQEKAVEWPDFEARRRAIFGDRVFEVNAVLEEREDSRY